MRTLRRHPSVEIRGLDDVGKGETVGAVVTGFRGVCVKETLDALERVEGGHVAEGGGLTGRVGLSFGRGGEGDVQLDEPVLERGEAFLESILFLSDLRGEGKLDKRQFRRSAKIACAYLSDDLVLHGEILLVPDDSIEGPLPLATNRPQHQS